MLSNFTKKAYEICYAIFRLGDAIKNTDLKARLEKAGLGLLEASSLNDNSYLGRSLSLLEALVVFSQGIGEIGYPQSQVLLREIGNLNSAIRQNNAAIADLNLEEFFQTPITSNYNIKPKVTETAITENKLINNEITSNTETEQQEISTVVEKDKENAAMRQSAIMEMMRQVQNCRIKDLIAAFPGVSERTLRYDLQKLCEEGTIERLGTGGPGTYYQIKSNVTSS